MLSQPPIPLNQNWLTKLWRLVGTLEQAGTTAQRPTDGLFIGRRYYDKSLNKPVWYDGSQWRDASGSIT
jgi:hypothetical protein